MKINIKKTKVMRVSKSEGGRVSIMIEGKRLNKFGISSISEARCQIMADVKRKFETRIALAKEALSKRKELPF